MYEGAWRREAARSCGPKQRDHDISVVDKGLRPNLVKAVPIILIYIRDFLKFEHPIFNCNHFFVLLSFKSEALHMAELVKVDRLELILKNLYDLFLRKSDKLEEELRDLGGNLTLQLIIPIYICSWLLYLSLCCLGRCQHDGGNLGL